MLENKIYISGQNLSGKTHLMYLLNGSSDIAGYPYHKFGLSCELNNFKNFISKRKNRYPVDKRYFELSDKILKVKLYDKEEIYEINLSEFIYFIIKNNGSMPYLLESHNTKKCAVFAGDTNYDFVNFDFDFNLFINSIEKNINLNKQQIFYLEDLDNIIFNSFLNSTYQYNSKLFQYKYYCQWTSNDINETNFLLKNYENIKLIYLTRDPVSSSYSIAKRILSKDNVSASKYKLKKLMIESIYNRKIKDDAFYNLVQNKSYKNKLLIVDFNDLLNNRDKTMENICTFLNIKFETSMKVPHMISNKINNLSFQKSKMNDDPQELFSVNELNRLKRIKDSSVKLFLYKYLYKIIFTVKYLLRK